MAPFGLADPMLARNYDIGNWSEGKLENKRSLQQQFQLPLADELPMIVLVGRLAEQKGWDRFSVYSAGIPSEAGPLNGSCWAAVTSGMSSRYVNCVMPSPTSSPFTLASVTPWHIAFEAASDLFVMPSRYEPCGLNQLYSLRYGTVPIVTDTGGLADTVVDCTPQTLASGTATGFYVRQHGGPKGDAEATDEAIGRALHLRHHSPEVWKNIVQTGMKQDWSWRKSATQYIELYERTAALKQMAH